MKPDKELGQGQFSVYWWDTHGTQHEELRFVSAEAAVVRCHSLTSCPASVLGLIQRVIITDGGDCTNFEWKKGEGVTFGVAQ